VAATADLALDQLVRAAATRVLYRAAPEPTGKAGRPRKDGALSWLPWSTVAPVIAFRCTDDHGSQDTNQ